MSPERLERLWKWTCEAIKTAPDVLPDERMFTRQHAGIASGYFQTQLLDLMVNCCQLLTILTRMGINIDNLEIKVQGDDSLIILIERIFEGLYSEFLTTFGIYFKEYFGTILNEKKSQISNTLDGLPVLGFTNRARIPTRDRNQLFTSLLYPERKSDEGRLMATAVSIAYAYCGQHPTVYRICEDIYSYLNSLGFSLSLV